jgi:hypothetical protein
MPVKYLALVIFAFAALATTLIARAQDATPVATSLAPPPEECTVAPITADRLNLVIAGAATAGTPEATAPEGAEAASPVASPGAFTMPEGTPADEATFAAVSAAVREYMACINAGDVAKILALYSDAGLRDLLAGAIAQGATGDQIIASFGTPAPLPVDQRTLLYGIDNIVIMEDGRAAALVVGDDLTKPGPPGPALIYFAPVNGAWLVDGFVATEEIVGS